jgi:hypothetical protein
MAWGPLVGSETAAGRFNRDVAQRGGDVNYTYDTNGLPVKNVDVDGRNERDFYARQDDRNERVYVGPAGETPLADAAAADKAEDVAAGNEVD